MVAPSEGSSSEKGHSLQRYLLSFSPAAAAAQMGTAVWHCHKPPSRDSDPDAVASSEQYTWTGMPTVATDKPWLTRPTSAIYGGPLFLPMP